jgi:hypothetical protein
MIKCLGFCLFMNFAYKTSHFILVKHPNFILYRPWKYGNGSLNHNCYQLHQVFIFFTVVGGTCRKQFCLFWLPQAVDFKVFCPQIPRRAFAGIWLHLNQTLLRIVFTCTLIYRKVSVLHVNRTFVRFTHDAYNGFRA